MLMHRVNSEIKVWGHTPWDSKGWEIGEKFARKWWWLIDEEVLSGANFWRGVRSEPGLTMGGIKMGL